MKTPVHITHSGLGPLREWEGDVYVRRVREQLAAAGAACGFVHEEDPRRAEFCVLLEGNHLKTRPYARALAAHPLVSARPDAVFVFSYDDYPVGLLPGLYVDLADCMAGDPRFRTWSYLVPPNPAVARAAAGPESERRWLFSFRGSRTAPVRDRLLALRGALGDRALVEEPLQLGFYQQTPEQQDQYVREMRESLYVLCPRGLGRNTHRLYEAMELGRAPVVLADGWRRPEGPDWDAFALFVAEERIAEVPALLARLEDEAVERGRRAREAWERWFSPGARVAGALRQIQSVARMLPPGAAARSRADWDTERFWSAHGLGLRQAVGRRVRRLLGR